MSYFHDEVQAQQRMKKLFQEARTYRLLPVQPGVSDHLLTAVGSWMVNTGERLKRLSALNTNDKKLSVIETANG